MNRKALHGLSIFLGVIGITIVGVETSWWTAAGLFIALWGNNIMMRQAK